ncbi:MAG: hypothetical protein LBC72_01450 [Spirochaetaceae bacterium]|jgi:hypothetical protein|nr:hypothetical protein [Spirochaetaceae bacterium]
MKKTRPHAENSALLTGVIPPLFIFSSVAFLLFAGGNVRGFTDSTQFLLLRCAHYGGCLLFLYIVFLNIAGLFRKNRFIAALLPASCLRYAIPGIFAAVYALLPLAIITVASGNVK